MTTRTPQIGSISTGTLRTPDLMAAFAFELTWLAPTPLDRTPEEMATLAAVEVWDEEAEDADETGPELVNELQDHLSARAPAYLYFGNTEGDGADLGWWPSMEQIEELPHVENGEEAKALGEDAVYVNDHGNVTVYGGDGEIIIDFV